MEKFVAEILITKDGDDWIVRVVKNEDWKGEALCQMRMYEGVCYTYVAQKNFNKFLQLMFEKVTSP